MAALQAYSGGPASGYSVLLMMPMIWFGLQATDRELVSRPASCLAACSYLPMLVFGAAGLSGQLGATPASSY